jgi:SAM-dependent methyltransferase
MNLLNLGCGARVHPDWENVDFQAAVPRVRAYDLRKGIPFPDAAFDVVYHSHLIEHFSKQLAPVFLRECHRVLKPGGLLRIAVPDLEAIVRGYLDALEKASQSLPGWKENYDWMVLELYDQAVREQSGRTCSEHYRQEPIPNWDFICKRVGAEAEAALAMVRAQSAANRQDENRISSKWAYVLRNFGSVLRSKIARMVLSREDYASLQLGRFRRGGEIHLWMYDAYSLARLLRDTGFLNPVRRAATESKIPNWAGYCLDNEPDGRAYKPDSLYMEASRP